MPILIALAFAAAVQDAPSVTAHVPVSLDRIRQGLQRTPTLRINTPPPEPPTFKVQIVEHPYFRAEPHDWTFDGGGVPTAAPRSGIPGSPPLVQVDALPMITAAKRSLGERAARREVQQAIAEFCAQYSCVLK